MISQSKFRGTGVALATPMNADQSIDFSSLERLVEHTIKGGVNYLVVQGTTGESPTTSWLEKLEILSFVIEKCAGRVPVVFGLGGNNTRELIEKATELDRFDIEAILSVSPYYNRPSQAGIEEHFKLLADSFPRPIILYNVPARTASNMTAETTLALANHPNIIGMKEASLDLVQCKAILKDKPDGFLLLSGDDRVTHELIKSGAAGIISVVANVLPGEFTSMVNATLIGDFVAARKLENKLIKAYDLLSQEGNPTSLKTALSVQKICSDAVRLPLIAGSNELREEWKAFFSNNRA